MQSLIKPAGPFSRRFLPVRRPPLPSGLKLFPSPKALKRLKVDGSDNSEGYGDWDALDRAVGEMTRGEVLPSPFCRKGLQHLVLRTSLPNSLQTFDQSSAFSHVLTLL